MQLIINLDIHLLKLHYILINEHPRLVDQILCPKQRVLKIGFACTVIARDLGRTLCPSFQDLPTSLCLNETLASIPRIHTVCQYLILHKDISCIICSI